MRRNYSYNSSGKGLVQRVAGGMFVSLCVACGVVACVHEAVGDPGAAMERPQEVRAIDPEVQRVQQALREQAQGLRYDLRIINFSDALVLRGRVETEQSRERVLAIARSVTTKPVRDELRLKPTPSDDHIAADIRTALEEQYPECAEKLTVHVREGVAYFTGSLRGHREIDQVLATALNIEGVRDIRSDVTIRGRPYSPKR